MRSSSISLLLLLTVFVGCSSQASVSSTIEVEDVPLLTAEEVSANIETFMRSINVSSSGLSCYRYIRTRYERWSPVTTYVEDGKWLVELGEFRWNYFEKTGAIKAVHQSVIAVQTNC